MSNEGKIESFTPQCVERRALDGMAYFTVLIETRPCGNCKAPTAKDVPRGADPFPNWYCIQYREQLARGGIKLIGTYRDDEQPLCVDCKNAGAATFTCALCKQSRTSNESEESFGSPSEHLCKHCYSTVPAKTWDEKTRELEEAHRYDFE